MENRIPPQKSLLNRFIQFVGVVLFYPFFFLHWIISKKENLPTKIAGILVDTLLLFPFWLATIGILLLAINLVLIRGGVFPVAIPTVGASMLPTLHEKDQLGMKMYQDFLFFKHTLGIGDLVTFENAKTDEELQKQNKEKGSFVKRIIALPGDTVLIKDGFVYVNNTPVKEPYILKPRSTFGGEAAKDCQSTAVPDGKVFVLGDNRKRSQDSRDIGLVSNKDIKYYLPFKEQTVLKTRWRESANDFTTANESTLDVSKYVELLNQTRKNNNMQPLRYDEKLSLSAQKRAKAILEYDDFKKGTTESKYTMQQAMQDSGYSNIVYGELPTTGYYDAQELIDNLFEFPKSEEFLLSKDYQDIGISTFIGSVNGCPMQVVVQHLGGYVPPNYKKEQIELWKTVLQELKSVQPGWQTLKEHEQFYSSHKEDVDKINALITTRISHIEAIVKRMEANEWLTTEEKGFATEDTALTTEQNQIATRLNNS